MSKYWIHKQLCIIDSPCHNWSTLLIILWNGAKSIELAMIYKLRMIASTASATEALIRDTDWWKASLGLKCAVLHVTCAGAPKAIWYAWFLHHLALNSQSFWWLIHSNDWLGFITTTNTTSVLLQMMFIHVFHK